MSPLSKDETGHGCSSISIELGFVSSNVLEGRQFRCLLVFLTDINKGMSFVDYSVHQNVSDRLTLMTRKEKENVDSS